MQFQPDTHESRISEARRYFFERGELPAGLLPDPIIRSWQRCAESRLDVSGRLALPRHEAGSVAVLKDESAQLTEHAQTELDLLQQQIAASQGMVILTNAQGAILETRGNPGFMNRARQVALAPGVCWEEHYMGTNAIGTALVEGRPVLVVGSEHYFERNHFLTCAAAPIADPTGRIIGLLDISQDSRIPQAHAFDLVQTAAQLIENRLFSAQLGNGILVHFHSRGELIGTHLEGLAAFSETGQLLAANRAAQRLLGIRLEEAAGQSFNRLFHADFDHLAEYAEVPDKPPKPIHLHNGVRACARADLSRSRRMVFVDRRNEMPKVEPAPVRPAGPDLLHMAQPGSPLHDVIRRARVAYEHEIPLLIEGETGTGKEVLAQALHQAGRRQQGPFVAINCAAIPENLIESELFGYQEGAFTGARRGGVPGKIREAHGGTLFLDEIGDMPAAVQVRLLRVLQERKVTPLGGGKSFAVDIAVVCATNRRLRDCVRDGLFRSDLYYRINGIRVELPPLRQRDDIAWLADQIVRSETGGTHRVIISPGVLDIFQRHPWPGNIRQMYSVLRTALALADPSPALKVEHLTADFLEDTEVLPSPVRPVLAAPENLADAEAAFICQAIEQHGGNVSATARALGVSRGKLYAILRRTQPATEK